MLCEICKEKESRVILKIKVEGVSTKYLTREEVKELLGQFNLKASCLECMDNLLKEVE